MGDSETDMLKHNVLTWMHSLTINKTTECIYSAFLSQLCSYFHIGLTNSRTEILLVIYSYLKLWCIY